MVAGGPFHTFVPAQARQHDSRPSLPDALLERKSHHRATVRPAGEVLIAEGLVVVIVQTVRAWWEEVGAQAGVLHRCLDVAGLVAAHSGEDERKGVEWLGAALFAEEFVRDDADRGRVESSAQIRTDGTTTTEAAADGFAKEVEELLGVLLVGLAANFL